MLQLLRMRIKNSEIQEIFEGMATKTRSCETIQNVCVSVSVWIHVVDISVERENRAA